MAHQLTNVTIDPLTNIFRDNIGWMMRVKQNEEAMDILDNFRILFVVVKISINYGP